VILRIKKEQKSLKIRRVAAALRSCDMPYLSGGLRRLRKMSRITHTERVLRRIRGGFAGPEPVNADPLTIANIIVWGTRL